MADNYATSGTVINYSGVLFDTNDTSTPLFNSLPRLNTNHCEFVLTSTYTSGEASQPEISESASLTAPDAAVVTRTQETNVTQIFQKATGVSYAKLSNAGTLGGVNVTGQANNVQNELDFQVGVKMKEIRKDVEYTILNGTYQKSTGDTVANKTRGFIAAVPASNTVTLSTADELKPDYIDDVLEKIAKNHGEAYNVVLVMNSTHLRQLNKWYSKENGYLMPASRTVGGRAIDTIVTPFGQVGVLVHEFMPAGKVLAVNLGISTLVEQPTPDKGNFFWEELSKTGAGIKGEIFGQLGLNYGASWYHGLIKGLSTTYTPKDYVISTKTIE